MLLLALSGLVAGLSGVCSVAYLDTAGPTAGAGYELTVLAATIIGGVKLTGGRGSIVGVLLGLCVIGIIQNLIVLWGVSPNWTQGVSGIVLIAAMTVTWLTRRERKQRQPNRTSVKAEQVSARMTKEECNDGGHECGKSLDRRPSASSSLSPGRPRHPAPPPVSAAPRRQKSGWKSWVASYLGKPVKIAMTCYNTTNPYFAPTKAGAEDAGAQLGVECRMDRCTRRQHRQADPAIPAARQYRLSGDRGDPARSRCVDRPDQKGDRCRRDRGHRQQRSPEHRAASCFRPGSGRCRRRPGRDAGEARRQQGQGRAHQLRAGAPSPSTFASRAPRKAPPKAGLKWSTSTTRIRATWRPSCRP